MRPPASTEQILHPDAYFDADEPQPVRIRAGAVLGSGWNRALAGTWGELQTRELLGRVEPARRPAGAATATSCGARGDDAALVMRWRWDTPRDEDEFESPAARGAWATAAWWRAGAAR